MDVHLTVAAALLLLTLAGCSRSPSEAELKAQQERFDSLVKASQAEELEKDRRSREAAMRIAQLATAPESRLEARAAEASDAAPASPATGVAVAPPAAVPPAPVELSAEDKAITIATARIRASLTDPESMRVRNAQTRDNNTVVCIEINAKNKFGGYVGFVPVIVTSEKLIFYKDIQKTTNIDELMVTVEFMKLNERLRCY